jgi:enoyl-CoA hydratase/carnithine racemase
MPAADNPLLTDRRGRVCVLTLNRPDKKNALSLELVETLTRNLEQLAREAEAPVLVIRGAGDEAFCSGFDIRSLPAGGPRGAAAAILTPVEALFQGVVDYPMPVIAMINGAAFGAGCELAVCCDIRLAADHARLGMPPARLGLVYPWTGLRRFVQTIGLRSTREMLFTGRTYQGTRLRELGLVDQLAPRAELDAVVFQLAEEIAANAPLALRGIKRILNLLLHQPAPSQAAIEESESLVAQALASEDLQEGQTAFLEKRRPRFKGK